MIEHNGDLLEQIKESAGERRTEHVQSKITPTELKMLDETVQWLQDAGYNVTRAALLRIFITSGLAAVHQELAAERAN
ncbi:hypothetical protein QM616_24655 [Rhodococcus fascians]|uniref:hypothetical protein n=1 Tax=Rhodococcoides fascians TaxID=1828 RepID=UPI0024B6A29F|nr:hypothetical protein [Rhodococcus fascians]MDJ0005920.1 hypothetical protein [Rhodococcus fascians]